MNMEYQQAIEMYVRALVDIATTLDIHHEARLEFDPGFLLRVLRDGFLQPVTTHERQRLLHERQNEEEFLLWYGGMRQKKMNWNGIGWIFPFQIYQEMERAYELITRAELEQKSWARVRQFVLSCRFKFQEAPIKIPTNIVKVRVKGDECLAAMRTLEKSPPNLRYVTRAMIDHLPPTNYLRKRIQMKIFVGEKLEPQVLTRRL